jgi:hypothetical protein
MDTVSPLHHSRPSKKYVQNRFAAVVDYGWHSVPGIYQTIPTLVDFTCRANLLPQLSIFFAHGIQIYSGNSLFSFCDCRRGHLLRGNRPRPAITTYKNPFLIL